jgi:uncharacterized protein (TIGR02099 family)
MTRFAVQLLRRLVALAALLIILAGALTLALRLALPHADGLRNLVADGIGGYLGADVSVGELGIVLRGLRPELTLDDATLRDPHSGEPLLALQALRVDLDLRASLLAAAPRIDGVTLVGARIEVRRGVDGRIGVRGLDQLDGGNGGGAGFFLHEGHFSLSDSDIYYTDAHAGVPTLAFHVRLLELRNQGRTHLLRVQATPPGDPAGALTLLADLKGPPDRPETWSGRIYADWRGSDLARLLQGRLPAHLRLATDGLHISTWNRLDGGRLSRSVSRIWLDDLVLRRSDAGGDAATAPSGNQTLDLGDLGGLIRWQADADGWRLDAPEIRLFGSLRGGEETALRLAGGSGRAIDAWLAGLPLERLAAITRFALPASVAAQVPADLRAQLDGHIAGRLEDLRLRLVPAGSDGDTDAPRWLVQGRLQGFGLGPEPAGPIPALQGLDLRFSASPSAGAIGLDAEDLRLDLRPHLIEPLALTRLAGLLQWRLTAETGVTLWSNALAADSADVASLSRFSLRLGRPDGGPFVDLHSHFSGGDADALPRYLPVSKMDDQLVDWLERAIVAAQLESGDLLLRGDLSRFPFDANDGRFELVLRITDGVLDYDPPRRAPADATADAATPAMRASDDAADWPLLRDADGTLTFDQRSLTIDIVSARILDVTVTEGNARLPNLWQPEVLPIKARGRGPLADGLAFLAGTPLADRVGGIPQALVATGSGDLALELGVPLRRERRFDYAGELRFDADARVSIRAADLTLTDIAGALAFDNQGLRATGLEARAGEQDISLDIRTRPGTDNAADADEDGGKTSIEVRGRTDLASLESAWPSPWWSIADGRVDWTLLATLDNADAVDPMPPLDLSLSADLAGVALDLPAPLGKAAGEARTAQLQTRLLPQQPSASPQRLDLRLRVGELGALAALRQQASGFVPERVAVDLNRLPDGLPNGPGIAVRGDLGVFDLAPWLAWQKAHAALLAGIGVATPELPLLPVRLNAKQLILGALSFDDLSAALTPTPGNGWRIALDAAENSGTLLLPGRNGGPLTLRLDHLDIAPLLQARSGAPSARSDADPRALPPLSLQIDALQRGPDSLGRLRLDAAPTPSGIRASELSLTGPLVRADGSGSWTRDATGFTQTELAVDLRSEDLGELLRNAGYYNALSDAPSTAKLALTWPGGPERFALLRARGSLDIDIGAGRMLELDAGVGRMLGVLNLDAIGRRLSLDFSDVLDEGFAFDAIRGKLMIGNGQARISQLDILASSADIRVRGVTDLGNKTFDQTLRVTPKIGTGVALAGAVAGGPLVGAAVLLADKLSGDAMDQLASFEYRVTGPWSAPEVQRVVDANGPRSVPDLLIAPEANGQSRATTPPPRRDSRAAPSPFLDPD